MASIIELFGPIVIKGAFIRKYTGWSTDSVSGNDTSRTISLSVIIPTGTLLSLFSEADFLIITRLPILFLYRILQTAL